MNEPEEQVKIVEHTPLRCLFGFHRWPKWSATREGIFHLSGIRGEREVSLLYQSRICPDCHRYSWRFV